MKRAIICLLCLTLTIVAASALSQEPSAQQNAAANQSQALNNKDVLAMENAGLTSDIILAKIKVSACDFDTSPAALAQLRAAKVSDDVILAMVQAPVVTSSVRTTDSQGVEAKSTLQTPGGYLGFFMINTTPPAHGVLLKTVAPNGPAARAGTKKGDILESLNGQPIASVADYQQKFSLLKPGTKVTLRILRKGQESDVTTTIAPLRATVTFVTVENGQVLHVLPNWAATWVKKNMENYPDVRFQMSGPASGEENYVLAFSFSSNALNGFQPVTHTDTSDSTSNISGTGTVTDNNGNSWDYTTNGEANTTTTTTTTTNDAYTRTYNGVYLTAYNAKGEAIGQEHHVYSTQTGGNQGTALGYNLGNAFGAIHAKDHLMEAILKDIGLVKHN